MHIPGFFMQNNDFLNISKRMCFLLIPLLIILFSCTRYPSVKLSKRIFRDNKNENIDSNKIDEILKRYRLTNEWESYPAKKYKINIYYKRYFTNVFYSTPLAEINNKGVEYALTGMLIEAETLFREVLNENSGFAPALNNLGVVYELLGDKEKAFSMYSRACITEPDNEFFRDNLLFFCDNKSNLYLHQYER